MVGIIIFLISLQTNSNGPHLQNLGHLILKQLKYKMNLKVWSSCSLQHTLYSCAVKKNPFAHNHKNNIKSDRRKGTNTKQTKRRQIVPEGNHKLPFVKQSCCIRSPFDFSRLDPSHTHTPLYYLYIMDAITFAR